MPIVVCPNCGARQDGGSKCRMCSTLFEYYQNATGAPAEVEDTRTPAPIPEKRPPSLAYRIYRVVTWGSLAGLILVVALIFHQQPPPQVASDPKAGERVEAKLRESESAAAAGNPQILRLDESEVNAFLSSNLALKKEGAQVGGAGTASTSDSAAAASNPSPSSSDREPTLEEVQSSVKDVKINMLEDRVQAYVLFDFHGKNMTLVLEGRLHAEDGYLRFEPISGKLGSLPIPQSTLASAVQRMLSSPENREKMRLPPDVADVQIKNGELVIVPRN